MKHNPFDEFRKPSEHHLPGEEEDQFISAIEERIGAQKKIVPLIPYKWMIGIAASILIVSVVFLLQPQDAVQFTQRQFEPYKNYKEEATRGENTISEAYQYYDNQEYEESINAFEKMGKISGLDALYYGIALQGVKNWGKSKLVLADLRKSIPSVHEEALLYHQAMNCFVLGQEQEAKALFQEILEDEESGFYAKAKKFMKKID